MSNESPASEARLPVIIGRVGLYATYVVAALFLLVIAGDLAVLVRHGPWVGWLALLVGTGPLLAVLLSTLASYTNYYGVWRVLRRKDVYDAGQDLKSHAADVPQAAQAALAGRAGCLPAVSTALLFCSLLLAIAPVLPPETPFVGALGTWNSHLGNLALVSSAATPTATPIPATATATLIVLPSPTATAVPRPTATATATPIPVVIRFSISPTSASSTGCATGLPPTPKTITLDNSGSNVAVSWRASAVENLSGIPWATITLASGTVAAHGRQTITVKPQPTPFMCNSSWHVKIVASGAGTYTFTYTIQ